MIRGRFDRRSSPKKTKREDGPVPFLFRMLPYSVASRSEAKNNTSKPPPWESVDRKKKQLKLPHQLL
jgi:hypothetical protein